MCATAAPALLFVLLVATLSLSIMCGNQMAAEGLPITRRVRGAEDYEDILAGNDFLSVLLESTLYRLDKETSTSKEEPLDVSAETISTEPYMRETREATNYFNEVPQTTESHSVRINTSDSSFSDGVIIAVHVSSSVGSQINKDSRLSKENISEPATHIIDQNYLPSEEHPSIIANSGKSELNVEEPAPITKDNEEDNSDSTVDLNRLQASIQNLPSSQHIAFNPSGFPNGQNKDNVPPFHHSHIYHDNPGQPGQARSVSYSTIIQDIQPTNEKLSETHERKERNYETGTIFGNSFENSNEKRKEIGTDSKIESTNYPPSSTTPNTGAAWQNNNPPGSLVQTETTAKNWAQSFSSPTPQTPKIYGRPEKNYEVDEAVSVVTNGRTHGVQQPQNAATQKPKSHQDKDKDQKVGYVVEGRNYRKYRVEERTSDGFIVGEYGVVSHDDGSLRGVRYTADGTINPRLIYDALMKFLSL